MRIRKIKIKNNEIEIYWEEYVEKTKNWDKHSLSSKDLPRPEMLEAMKLWNANIARIYELPPGYEKRITAHGISISYDDETGQEQGIVASGTMELKTNNAPACLNTPYKPFDVPEGMDEDLAVTPEMYKDYKLICEEALRYIAGDRAEMNLFEQKEGSIKHEDNCSAESEGGSRQDHNSYQYSVPAQHQNAGFIN